ncbi:MAG: ABC transporter ATP-binding protein [Verrucomicrobiales bacterium]
MPGSPTLEIQGAVKRYAAPAGSGSPAIAAVDGISLSVAPGEFVALTGPSGCGKSTLLLMAGALMRPDAGTVRIGGEDPYALPPDARAEFRARRIGFVFQQFHLIPYLSVRDNVRAPELAARTTGGGGRADELLAQMGLADRAHHTPGALSAGEQQRCAMARALFPHPALILADEPTGNLDAENAQAILAALRDFAQAGGSVLMATHSDAAQAAADRALRLAAGRLAD